MTLRASPRLLLVAAVVTAVALTAYRVGAVTSARPVVRQQFVRRLDPAMPDLVITDPFVPPVISNSACLISNTAFSEPWTDPSYDDSGWRAAMSYGQNLILRDQGFAAAETIWDESVQGGESVLFRKTFDSAAAGDAVLLIWCDDQFQVYLDGEFIGAGSGFARLSLVARIRAGRNVLAIQGTNGVSDAGLACVLTSILVGSGWAIFDVPGLSPQVRATAEIQRLSTDSATALIPELRATRQLSSPVYPLAAGEGRVLVRLKSGILEGTQSLIEPGTYRLIVDTVAP